MSVSALSSHLSAPGAAAWSSFAREPSPSMGPPCESQETPRPHTPEQDVRLTRSTRRGGQGRRKVGALKPSPMDVRGQCSQPGRESRTGRFSRLQAELEVRAANLDLSQCPDRSVLQNRKKAQKNTKTPPRSASGSFSEAPQAPRTAAGNEKGVPRSPLTGS